MLNYHHERILETYYAMRVLKGLTMTFDYQYMINPAYNADRNLILLGPAAWRVLSVRRAGSLHETQQRKRPPSFGGLIGRRDSVHLVPP
jgi:hypothetical protein